MANKLLGVREYLGDEKKVTFMYCLESRNEKQVEKRMIKKKLGGMPIEVINLL